MTWPSKINVLLLIVFAILGIYFTRVRTAGDTADTYWHLAVGRQVWQQKQIAKTDDFVYGKTDTHYTSTEWLSGLIFYLSDKLFGFSGLTALRIICGLGTIFFLYKAIEIFYQGHLKTNLTTTGNRLCPDHSPIRPAGKFQYPFCFPYKLRLPKIFFQRQI